MPTPRALPGLLASLLIACSGGGAPAGDAAPDAPPVQDGGPDAAAPDAPPDDVAGGTDAPASPSVECVESGAIDPWHNRIGAHTLADRGTILSCMHVASHSRDEVSRSRYFRQQGWTADNGYDTYIIQYVSEGSPGRPRAITALAYLPQGGGTDVPVVAVTHGTSGMGPSCGPTHQPIVTDYMAVPLAGRGYAVVATDYAGMGVDDGLSPYLVGDAEAAAALDSVRAIRRLRDRRFDAARLGRQLFVMGHSQGGQAALFTHQRYDPSVGFDLLGSISFAPALGDVRGLSTAFDAARRTDQMGVFVLMALYGSMVYHERPDPMSWLTPEAERELPRMLHDQCLVTLFTTIPARFPRQGDLYGASFLAAARSCPYDGPCPAFEPWTSFVRANVPGDFASPVPALILQGERDTVVTPASTACIRDRMEGRTPLSACGYAADDHLSVVGTGMPDALRWMEGRRRGQTPSVCAAPIAARCP